MAERAELEAAAGALLTYHLGGQRTDDALLAQIQAAWVEYEALRQEQQERVLLQVGRGRQAARAEFSRQERVGLGRQLQATMDRYLAGWRSWFDRHTGQDTHQTVSTDAGVAARSVEPSPRCPDGGGGRRCRTGPYCLG